MSTEREARKKQLTLLMQTVSGQERIRDAYTRIRKMQGDSGVLSIGPRTPKPIGEMVEEILDAEFSSDGSINA